MQITRIINMFSMYITSGSSSTAQPVSTASPTSSIRESEATTILRDSTTSVNGRQFYYFRYFNFILLLYPYVNYTYSKYIFFLYVTSDNDLTAQPVPTASPTIAIPTSDATTVSTNSITHGSGR